MQSNRARGGWLVAIVGLAVFVALGLSRISFNVDILRMLPTNLRQVRSLSIFLKNFAESDELIITVEAPTADAAAKAADDIAARLNATPKLVRHAVARPPWEKRPADLAEMLAFLLLNQPPEAARALAARLSPAQAPATLQGTLEKLTDSVSPQEIGLLSYDPYDLAGPLTASLMASSGAQQSEFASADGLFHVIYVQAAPSLGNYNDAIAWIDAIHAATAPWQGRDGCRLGFTGEPAFVASISASMQRDMSSSGLVTLLVIALIFWLVYRRVRPLAELQAMLLLIFLIALSAAGLFLDQLTVIGVGCAAIMIGLSVDYGYFVYQRARNFRGTLRELQRQCLGYIAWTAGTTAAAFFALNVSSLPGLAQLGNLVGIGVVVGAVVMLTVFAPLILRRQQREADHAPTAVERWVVAPEFYRVGAWLTGALVVGLLGGLIWKGFPGTDFSAKPLRPRHSEAYDTIDRLSARLMSGEGEPLSLVVHGDTVEAVRRRLLDAETQLTAAQRRGDVRSFQTALPLWPDEANQRTNLPVLAALVGDAPRLRQAMLDAGFKDDAFTLTDAVLAQWAAWSARPTPIWPDNAASRWIYRRLARYTHGQWFALGVVQPIPGHEAALDDAVHGEGIDLTGWHLLTFELRRVVPREFERAIIGITVAVVGLLAFAFRDVRSVVVFVVATALVFLCLMGAMSLLGMQWNFFNLAALLLLLGTGTDYSILLLLALRRNGGDVAAGAAGIGAGRRSLRDLGIGGIRDDQLGQSPRAGEPRANLRAGIVDRRGDFDFSASAGVGAVASPPFRGRRTSRRGGPRRRGLKTASRPRVHTTTTWSRRTPCTLPSCRNAAAPLCNNRSGTCGRRKSPGGTLRKSGRCSNGKSFPSTL